MCLVLPCRIYTDRKCSSRCITAISKPIQRPACQHYEYSYVTLSHCLVSSRPAILRCPHSAVFHTLTLPTSRTVGSARYSANCGDDGAATKNISTKFPSYSKRTGCGNDTSPARAVNRATKCLEKRHSLFSVQCDSINKHLKGYFLD